MNIADNLIKAMSDTRNIDTLPSDYIDLVKNELDGYLKDIVKLDSIDQADSVLDNLGRFQEKLAELSFRYEVPFSDKINKFIQLYDRSDDPDARQFFFDLVRKGELA